MRIQVTQKHIDKANIFIATYGKQSSFICPIALALQESYDLNSRCYRESCVVFEKILDLPLTAKEFVKKFDTNQQIAPFEFTLPYEPAI